MAAPDGPPLDVSDLQAVIAAWRVRPDQEVDCPVCGAGGISISDHSARPHAEWYRLVCGSCGLDQMISVPLGAAVPGGEG